MQTFQNDEHFTSRNTERFYFCCIHCANPTPTSKLWTTIRPIITNWLLLFPQEWREKSLLTLLTSFRSVILWTSRGFSSLWASVASNRRITTPALLAIGRDFENPAANRPNKAEQLPAQTVIAVSSRYHQQLHKQILISLARLPELTIRWNWAKEEIPLQETIGVSFWYPEGNISKRKWRFGIWTEAFYKKDERISTARLHHTKRRNDQQTSLIRRSQRRKMFSIISSIRCQWRGGKPIEVERQKNR